MAGRQCFHCKQWLEEGEAHDCWTTTETALTADLSEDLREAYERLRETAVEFGEQRIYASHSSIMFSRRACYFFVRPKAKYLEVCVFLGRALRAEQVRSVMPASTTKFAHLLRVVHRDEVESPITDWLAEAYAFAGLPPAPPARKRPAQKRSAKKPSAHKRASRTARSEKRMPKAASSPRRKRRA